MLNAVKHLGDERKYRLLSYPAQRFLSITGQILHSATLRSG